MKKQNNIVLLTALVIFNLIFTNCEKTSKSIQTDKLENFHIKSIGKELELLSKAMIPVIQNKRNVEIIKEAIYQKKRDENITLKDLFNFHNGLITKPGFGNERVISLEQQILDNINQYQAMTLDELRSLIETYDISLYWEFIQLWDGTTQPQVGYPTNEEEDINHEYDLMTYKVFTSQEDINGINVIRTYLKDNPVILIRPLENFENGGEDYYGDIDYIWLEDIKFTYENKEVNLKNSSNFRINNQQSPTVVRLKEITTNGNLYDGSGGPEFRFCRVGGESPLIAVSTFSQKITMNLTTSVASQTGWFFVNEDIGLSDVLDYDWKAKKENQHFGCWEQDGGLDDKVKYLYASLLETGGLISVFIDLNLGVGIRLQRNDDIIHRIIIDRTTYVNYFLTGYDFDGVRNGRSIVVFNNEVPNNDLKVVLSDL